MSDNTNVNKQGTGEGTAQDAPLFNVTVGVSNVGAAANKRGRKLKCSTQEFCLTQGPLTLEHFNALKAPNKLHAMLNIINQFKEDEHLLLLIFTSLKCAHLSKVSKEALEVASALIKTTFVFATKTDQEDRVMNYYLKQLGLLRSEVPFKTDYDMDNCRYALRTTIAKQEFANAKIRNTFLTFLDQLDK